MRALPGFDSRTPLIAEMLQAGEKTGKVDDMLQRISEFYDDEVQAMLSGLTSLIEPLLMVFLGGTVGYFMIAMYLPIFSMAGTIK